MSTEVSANVLKSFLANNLGIRKLDLNQAHKYDIDDKKFAEADTDENGLEINEILQDADLYAQFATLYVESKEEADNTKDGEKEKDEKNKVNEKSGAGAA